MDWMIPLLENSQDEGWSLYSKVASGLDKGVLDDAFIRWQETLKDEATRTSETDILADSIRSALILALLWVPNKMIPMDARHTANEVVALARHDTNAYIRTLGNIASERVTDGKLNIDVEKFEDGKSAIGSLYCDVRAAVEEHALHIHPLELPYLDPSVVASINPSGAEGIASLQQKAYRPSATDHSPLQLKPEYHVPDEDDRLRDRFGISSFRQQQRKSPGLSLDMNGLARGVQSPKTESPPSSSAGREPSPPEWMKRTASGARTSAFGTVRRTSSGPNAGKRTDGGNAAVSPGAIPGTSSRPSQSEATVSTPTATSQAAPTTPSSGSREAAIAALKGKFALKPKAKVMDMQEIQSKQMQEQLVKQKTLNEKRAAKEAKERERLEVKMKRQKEKEEKEAAKLRAQQEAEEARRREAEAAENEVRAKEMAEQAALEEERRKEEELKRQTEETERSRQEEEERERQRREFDEALKKAQERARLAKEERGRKRSASSSPSPSATGEDSERPSQRARLDDANPVAPTMPSGPSTVDLGSGSNSGPPSILAENVPPMTEQLEAQIRSLIAPAELSSLQMWEVKTLQQFLSGHFEKADEVVEIQLGVHPVTDASGNQTNKRIALKLDYAKRTYTKVSRGLKKSAKKQ